MEMTLKQFVEQFNPKIQNDKPNFNKYLLPFIGTTRSVQSLCTHYYNFWFTGYRTGDQLILKPGRCFHIDDSFHILTTIQIEDLETEIIINL